MCGHVAASLAQTAAITCVQVVNSGASVAVRAGPSADANQVGAVSSGMTVAATAESASWLKITMADTGVASIEPQYFDPAGYILKSHPSAGPLLVPASGGQPTAPAAPAARQPAPAAAAAAPMGSRGSFEARLLALEALPAEVARLRAEVSQLKANLRSALA